MKQWIWVLLSGCIFFAPQLIAQSPTQAIRGTVIDKDSRQPLVGAAVVVLDVQPQMGNITDPDGFFVIEKVPVGRHKIRVSMVGYNAFLSDNIDINSAKELVLNIELIESATTMQEMIVKAYNPTNQPINELAVVSTRSFSVEETQRAAAAANDPSRMAMGFPGVQPVRDSRSDIVIRGNASFGMMWRLEGIDIPNPNHFARRGSSGGGITIFSTSMLANSDFSTGAFPAEYGNAFSGFFDMKFRKGNADRREYTVKAGLLGLDFSTEGYFKKGSRASYLINYRYSTLGILNKLGLHLVGERVDNTFQDLSFNLHFPSKNNKWVIGVWAIGGLSFEHERFADVLNTRTAREQYDFRTNMGALGISYSYILDEKSYLKTTIAVMDQKVDVQEDTLSLVDKVSTTRFNSETYTDGRVTLSTYYSRKLSQQVTLKAGVFVNRLFYDFNHITLKSGAYRVILEGQGGSFLIQPYVQARYRPTERLTFNAGVHGLFFTLNNTTAIEPRAGIKYQVSDKISLGLAYGLHSRTQPLGSYFTNGGVNKDLDLIRAHHYVVSFDWAVNAKTRVHLEAYYQRLLHIPVSPDPLSTYAYTNETQGFATQALVSKGRGENKGIDLSLERAFSDGAFFILSGSVFQSRYSPLNGQWYRSRYDSRFTATFMGGKEWKTHREGVWQVGTRIICTGGMPLTPLAAVQDNVEDPVLDEAHPFSINTQTYFRPDLRIAFRKNGLKTAWTIALDVQNVIARRNIDGLDYEYDPDLKDWVFRKSSGLVPIISYQLDF